MLQASARQFVKQESIKSSRLAARSLDSERGSLVARILEEDVSGGVGLASPKSDLEALKGLLTSSWLNVLLVAIPLTFLSEHLQWGAVWTFVLSFTSLIPLALVLGDVTEDLAIRFGDVIGGLLNASFGNIVELLVSLSALQKNLFVVISTSLMGSILSNLLLVLGFSFFCGGLIYKTQTFNATSIRACSSLLFLSCLGILLPTASVVFVDNTKGATANADEIDPATLALSRGTAVVLLICYVCYLVFQLKTHKDLFVNEDDDEESVFSLPCAIGVLAAITVIVAFCSEYLTGSIEEVVKTTGISQAFIGFIVLPIAGNACEHITAVVVAMKNKMDLSLAVAVGSSLQIATFAIPFTVIVAWVMDKPFGLVFDPFSALALTLSVIHANYITSAATSHWLLGAELIAVYVILAITFYLRK